MEMPVFKEIHTKEHIFLLCMTGESGSVTAGSVLLGGKKLNVEIFEWFRSVCSQVHVSVPGWMSCSGPTG